MLKGISILATEILLQLDQYLNGKHSSFAACTER